MNPGDTVVYDGKQYTIVLVEIIEIGEVVHLVDLNGNGICVESKYILP